MNSTREAYGQVLAELGEKYPIYVFDADLSKAHRLFILRKSSQNDLLIWELRNQI